MITGLAKNIIAGVFVILMILCLVYVGSCSYAWYQDSQTLNIDLPNPEDAAYSVKIRNTNNVFLSDDVEKEGTVVIMNGYYQLDKHGKYAYVDDTAHFDSKTFGPIEVNKR